jgi:beta-lactamase superfamily II metal-dependent hydrolase
MNRVAAAVMTAVAMTAAIAQGTGVVNAQSKPLVMYFIDVEGGQSTLVVTPAGESLLIDAGFPGDGAFSSTPGDPAKARDAQRILAAARDAGVKRIDYLLVTHFHADHDGGIPELSQLLPVGTFIDHGEPGPGAAAAVTGTQLMYDKYLAVRARAKHIEPRPGDALPIKGIEAVVIASAGAVLPKPLRGAGQRNSACAGNGIDPQEKTENPRSTAVRLQYGAFRFLDVGDLSGAPLFALTCPSNLIGRSDVYLVAHHGGADAADPALFKAVNPRVVIFNNGQTKGAQKETLATVGAFPGIDSWQLHRTSNKDAVNAPDARIANLDDSTSAWIKISATRDGGFTVTNGRTGATKRYPGGGSK